MSKIQEISEALKESAKVVERVAQTVTEMAMETEKRVENINELSDISHSIRESVATLHNTNQDIKYIDNQTTILSLNTAIQAAHLGKQGGAFSVIAKEMKNLAEKSMVGTANMTKLHDEIGCKTKDINDAIDIAKENAEMNSAAMQDLAAMAEELASTIEAISDALQHLVED